MPKPPNMSPAKELAWEVWEQAAKRMKLEGEAWQIANSSQIDIIKKQVLGGATYAEGKAVFDELYIDHMNRYQAAFAAFVQAGREFDDAP